MNTLKKLASAICLVLLMNACAPLKTPVIVKNAPIERFKYVYISPTKELTSSTGSTYGGQYGIYGSSTTRSVNPSDVIAGMLIQKGYVILPELNPELAKETFNLFIAFCKHNPYFISARQIGASPSKEYLSMERSTNMCRK